MKKTRIVNESNKWVLEEILDDKNFIAVLSNKTKEPVSIKMPGDLRTIVLEDVVYFNKDYEDLLMVEELRRL